MFIIVLKRKSEGDSITSNFIKKREKERSLSTKELQQKKEIARTQVWEFALNLKWSTCFNVREISHCIKLLKDVMNVLTFSNQDCVSFFERVIELSFPACVM